MGTVKKFIKYIIAGILLFIFVTFASTEFVKQTYQFIDYDVETSSPEIIIDQVRATSVNGYVKGIVNNDTEHYIDNINLKVDTYGRTGTYLGSKYYSLGNFKQNEAKEFNVSFKFDGVKECKISLTREEAPVETLEEIPQDTKLKYLGVTLLILILIQAYL